MTDAEFEAQLARIRPLVDRWCDRLHLWDYLHELTIRYDRDGDDMTERGYRDSAGITTVWWEYKRASVIFDLSKVVELSDAMLEYVVVHEFMHIYLQQVIDAFAENRQVTDLQGAHVERTATDLAQALMWATAPST